MVDPQGLLNAIDFFLDDNGGARDTDSMDRIVGFMRDNATKIASRTIYLFLLKSTADLIILQRFVTAGGWHILSQWLDDAVQDDTIPFLTELLKVFQHVPVSLETLKSTVAPKTIRRIARITDSNLTDAVTIARALYRKWKAVIEKAETAKSAPPEPTAVTPPKRQPTVKVAPAKFRHTGLEGPTVKDEVKEKLPGSSLLKPPAKRVSLEHAPSNEHKKQKVAEPLPTKPVPSGIPQASNHSTVTKRPHSPKEQAPPMKLYHQHSREPGPPRLKPAVPQPPKVVKESSTFMDALTTHPPSQPAVIRRKKRVSDSGPPSKVKPSGSTSPRAPTLPSPADQSQQPPRLDTVEQKGDGDSKSDSSLEGVPPPVLTPPPPKPKKKVTWAEESQLRMIQHFVMDEDERVNVHKLKQTGDMKRAEMMMEGEMMRRGTHREEEPPEDPTPVWRLVPITDINWGTANETLASFVPGNASRQSHIQAERQKKILEVVYFSPGSIPISPAEPDNSDPLDIHNKSSRSIRCILHEPPDDENDLVKISENDATQLMARSSLNSNIQEYSTSSPRQSFNDPLHSTPLSAVAAKRSPAYDPAGVYGGTAQVPVATSIPAGPPPRQPQYTGPPPGVQPFQTLPTGSPPVQYPIMGPPPTMHPHPVVGAHPGHGPMGMHYGPMNGHPPPMGPPPMAYGPPPPMGYGPPPPFHMMRGPPRGPWRFPPRHFGPPRPPFHGENHDVKQSALIDVMGNGYSQLAAPSNEPVKSSLTAVPITAPATPTEAPSSAPVTAEHPAPDAPKKSRWDKKERVPRRNSDDKTVPTPLPTEVTSS